MNEYDSERMAEILEPFNYSPVNEPDQADLIILNTCHIREKAAVCGCGRRSLLQGRRGWRRSTHG